jgi:hypothetical protein
MWQLRDEGMEFLSRHLDSFVPERIYDIHTAKWQKKKWKTIDADLDKKSRLASIWLPKETTVYYFNIADNRNLVVSSEYEEIEIWPNKPDAHGGS